MTCHMAKKPIPLPSSILLDTLELETAPRSDFINLENGILDIWTGELLQHSAEGTTYSNCAVAPALILAGSIKRPGGRNFKNLWLLGSNGCGRTGYGMWETSRLRGACDKAIRMG